MFLNYIVAFEFKVNINAIYHHVYQSIHAYISDKKYSL